MEEAPARGPKGPEVGEVVELTAGAMAAGGACVARDESGRVVFVRHALPGERVRARIVSTGARYARADAIEVLDPSPDRVEPPCAHAGPGACGGCDFQHVALGAQRRAKSRLIAEALSRVAGIEAEPVVEDPGGPDGGLAWRTRARFSATGDGRLGFRRHRSHDVEPVASCPIVTVDVDAVGVQHETWPPGCAVEVLAAPDGGGRVVNVTTVRSRHRTPPSPRIPALDAGLVVDEHLKRRPSTAHFEVLGRSFSVSAGVFWQVHANGAAVLGAAVLEALAPLPGEQAVDLYAGVGLFAALLGEAVGPTGGVTAVERDPRACADAARNLVDLGQVAVLERSVTAQLVERLIGHPDLVVLDPAREGAGVEVCAALAALDPAPRRLAYVSCDAWTFARDVAVLREGGLELTALRAFDLFPMTEHVELLGILEPSPTVARPA